ncbi:MAG TPA: hypothetical protein VGB82_10460 [Alphaproteobacteria bacterium]
MGASRTVGAAIGLCLLGSACAGVDQPSSTMTADERAAAYASVNVVDACYKPWFDTVSASDHRTIVKGMTPIEREVCAEHFKADGNNSR